MSSTGLNVPLCLLETLHATVRQHFSTHPTAFHAIFLIGACRSSDDKYVGLEATPHQMYCARWD